MFFWAVRSMLGEKEGDYLAGFVVLYAWCMLLVVQNTFAKVVWIVARVIVKDHCPWRATFRFLQV